MQLTIKKKSFYLVATLVIVVFLAGIVMIIQAGSGLSHIKRLKDQSFLLRASLGKLDRHLGRFVHHQNRLFATQEMQELDSLSNLGEQLNRDANELQQLAVNEEWQKQLDELAQRVEGLSLAAKRISQLYPQTFRPGDGAQALLLAKEQYLADLINRTNINLLAKDYAQLSNLVKSYLLAPAADKVELFKKQLEIFRRDIQVSRLRMGERNNLLAAALDYGQAFETFSQLNEEIINAATALQEAENSLQQNVSLILKESERLASEQVAELVSTLSTQRWLIVVITAIVLLFAVIFGWFYQRTIVKPLMALQQASKRLAIGGELSERIHINTQDELHEIAENINTFLAKIQETFETLRKSAEEVAQVSKEVTTSSEQMATGAEEQQAQISEVATAIEEMSAMILEASKNAGETRQEAEVSNQNAGEGAQQVQAAIQGMEEIARMIDIAAEKIQRLEQRSQEIGEVVQVIDDIADQTNLLALNANIEAARAGDAGRGFAVVADEVRKLAERTLNATAEIGEKIQQIQRDVTEAVKATAEVKDQSQKGVELAILSGQALEKIAASSSNVMQSIMQIAAGADEQSSAAEEISKNVEGISTVAKQAAEQAQELAHSAERLNNAVLEMATHFEQFRTAGNGQENIFRTIETFKAAHLNWVKKVRTMLDGGQEITPHPHTECALGQWYFGRGQLEWGDLPEFKAINAPHEHLHNLLKEIFNAHRLGDNSTSERLFQELTQTSHAVVAALEELGRALRAQ